MLLSELPADGLEMLEKPRVASIASTVLGCTAGAFFSKTAEPDQGNRLFSPEDRPGQGRRLEDLSAVIGHRNVPPFTSWAPYSIHSSNLCSLPAPKVFRVCHPGSTTS
jgi:hypothetical protein